MNRNRRRQIKEVITQLETCADTLENVKNEEDDARENMPENLQDGGAYCTSEECSDKIEDAISDIRAVIENIEDI